MSATRRPRARRGVMPAESEDAFAVKLAQFAGYHGWMHYHTHRSDRSPPGFPDEVFVRDVRLVFAELKRDRAPARVRVADRAAALAWRPEWLSSLAITEPQARWLDALERVGSALERWLPDRDDFTKLDPDPLVPPIPTLEVYVWTPSDWPTIERILAR